MSMLRIRSRKGRGTLRKYNFEPYITFLENTERIEEFTDLSALSYGLAQQLLFKHKKSSLKGVEIPDPGRDEISFSMGECRIRSIEVKFGWLTLPDYAEQCCLPLVDVERAAKAGKLGPVLKHPKDGNDIVIWPPEKQSDASDKLPEPGMKKVHIVLTADLHTLPTLDPADAKRHEAIQRQYLSLAHSLGTPREVGVRAKEMLNRSGFLLHWTAFEIFMRTTVQHLMFKHPHKIAAGTRGKKYSLNYDELVTMSAKLKSIDVLRNRLIEREIERLQSGAESVHGLIKFLKQEFHFQNDPYEAWYVLGGQFKVASYGSLMQVKGARNALLHTGGRVGRAFIVANQLVPVRRGFVIINEEFFLRAKLILKSIAHSIAHSISTRTYCPN